MTIDIRFDANQQFQLDAIKSVVDLFDGQEMVEQTFALSESDKDAPGMLPGFAELVFGNALSLSPESLCSNLRAVQDRIITAATGDERPAIPESLRKPI